MNARLFNESGQIPVIGQGKKKPKDDKDALEMSKDYFRDLAKNGRLNLPLDQPDPTGNGGNTGKSYLSYALHS